MLEILGVSICYLIDGPQGMGLLHLIECGYGFPALIHVWISSAGMLEWF